MGNLDKRTSRWKCQSTDPVSFTSETSCLCTRKARSMASSALWGKLRVSRFSPRSSFQMARLACLLAFTLRHLCTLFSPNHAHRGRLGLDVNVLWPRPPVSAQNRCFTGNCAQMRQECTTQVAEEQTFALWLLVEGSASGSPRGYTGIVVMGFCWS